MTNSYRSFVNLVLATAAVCIATASVCIALISDNSSDAITASTKIRPLAEAEAAQIRGGCVGADTPNPCGGSYDCNHSEWDDCTQVDEFHAECLYTDPGAGYNQIRPGISKTKSVDKGSFDSVASPDVACGVYYTCDIDCKVTVDAGWVCKQDFFGAMSNDGPFTPYTPQNPGCPKPLLAKRSIERYSQLLAVNGVGWSPFDENASDKH